MIRLATIALLGRADTPTDAVEEYCWYLSEALRAQGIRLTIERVPWEEGGWGGALQALRGRAKTWKGLWVIVQYTALAWSSRGPSQGRDRKSTRLNSSHPSISYAVFCLKKKKPEKRIRTH